MASTKKTVKKIIKKRPTIKHLVFDVDGVFTTGQFLYTAEGKFAKVFGAHDNDGIKLIKPHVSIHAITADKRGYEVTKKRISDDMGLDLHLVPEGDRLAWMKEHFEMDKTAYVGDGIFDAYIFGHVCYGIAPANAFHFAKKHADYVTKEKSGEGAVAEACLHLLGKFFEYNSMLKELSGKKKKK